MNKLAVKKLFWQIGLWEKDNNMLKYLWQKKTTLEKKTFVETHQRKENRYVHLNIRSQPATEVVGGLLRAYDHKLIFKLYKVCTNLLRESFLFSVWALWFPQISLN